MHSLKTAGYIAFSAILFLALTLTTCTDPNRLLWDAVDAGNPEAAAAALEKGADIETRAYGPGDNTPLSEAVRKNDLAMVRLLIAKGANVEGPTPLLPGPLLMACLSKNEEIARALVGGGANPNVVVLGNSPLSVAVSDRNASLVKFLLLHGADPDLPTGHDSPRSIAERRGDTEIIRILTAATVR